MMKDAKSAMGLAVAGVMAWHYVARWATGVYPLQDYECIAYVAASMAAFCAFRISNTDGGRR